MTVAKVQVHLCHGSGRMFGHVGESLLSYPVQHQRDLGGEPAGSPGQAEFGVTVGRQPGELVLEGGQVFPQGPDGTPSLVEALPDQPPDRVQLAADLRSRLGPSSRTALRASSWSDKAESVWARMSWSSRAI